MHTREVALDVNGTKRPKGNLDSETRYKVVRKSLGCETITGTVPWGTVSPYHMCFVGVFGDWGYFVCVYNYRTEFRLFFWNPCH